MAGVMFDDRSARRIASAVKAVERLLGSGPYGARPGEAVRWPMPMVPAQITGGGPGTDHTADIYARGKLSPASESSVTIKILDIDAATQLPAGTWVWARRLLWLAEPGAGTGSGSGSGDGIVAGSWYWTAAVDFRVLTDTDDKTPAVLKNKMEDLTTDAYAVATDGAPIKAVVVTTSGVKKLRYYLPFDAISGWSGSAKQVLMNDEGTVKWVTAEECE